MRKLWKSLHIGEETMDLNFHPAVKCPHCNFEADYESYLEIMKENVINMTADYIPDRPGF